MPLEKMSYNTANKIFDLYCEKLINLDKLGRYRKYSYSDLGGYDVIDISNAMKLLAANRIFNTYTLDENKKTEFKNYASQEDSALMSFFFHFFPDEIANEIRRINPDDEKSILEYARLTRDSTNSEMYHLLNEEETIDSFYNYCVHVGRSDLNFWGKVYSRIGITWETNDDRDLIYVLIKHGVNFQSNESPKEIAAEGTKVIKPIGKSKNIFSILKERFLK